MGSEMCIRDRYTEEQVIENANDIRRFCKENNLANMAPKVKEKER